MRILHFANEFGAGVVRIQRYLQSNLNMGMQPVVFCRKWVQRTEKKRARISKPWIPDIDKVPIEYFGRSRRMEYLLPPVYDEIGLKKVFKKYKCDLVHAHNLEAAYYSYKTGLPTLFDDWEYYYEFLDYWRIDILNVGLRRMATRFLLYLKKKRFKNVVKELIQKVPVISTNEEVERRYRELGASLIWWVPNVPLSYEKDYAFAIDVQKKNRITTCYIGDMSSDEKTILRNTSGIRELWKENDIGDLYVFEGKNYVPHLEVLRKVRECHFNLLYWKPLAVHRYYLQNKAFIASVVGVPTIISSSLTATVNLLKDYALPVLTLEDIPEIIKNYDHSKKYQLNPAHLWESYEPKIKKAYEATLEGI